MAEDDVGATSDKPTAEAKWKDRFFLLLSLYIFQVLLRLYELVGKDNQKIFGVGLAFLGLGLLSFFGLYYLYIGKTRHVIAVGNLFLISLLLIGLVWTFMLK